MISKVIITEETQLELFQFCPLPANHSLNLAEFTLLEVFFSHVAPPHAPFPQLFQLLHQYKYIIII